MATSPVTAKCGQHTEVANAPPGAHAERETAQGFAREHAATLRIAYLTNKYPSVSHTFIRRELRAIEQRGNYVLRLAIRPPDSRVVEPLDQEEIERTLHVVRQSKSRLVLGVLRTALGRPLRFLGTLGLAWKLGHLGAAGMMRHVAYLLEAAYLVQVLRQRRIQHVHVHFATNPAAVARFIRRLGGPSYSFTLHGPEEFDAPLALDVPGKVADAAFVVAITDFCAGQLRRWVALDDWAKIHVVHCTVGEDFLTQSSRIDPHTRTFVCVGRLCPQKAQLLLIDAMAKLRDANVDCRLVLAGDGEMRALVEQRIRDLRLAERVEITGWISEAEVRRHLRAARALVLPSFAEGLPMVIMEAFAVGRPVISTYIAGIPELVRSGENGWLVPSGNVAALVDAMRAALDAPVERLEAMAAAGREAVRVGHHTATEAARMESLFARYTAVR